MPWTTDRGRHGIPCFVCHGKGRLLAMRMANGDERIVECQDCGGTGHVKHCVGCNGTGRVDLADGYPIDCPECSGKGYPLPKRIHIVMGT